MTSERNRHIDAARTAAIQGGASGLDIYQLDSILQLQTSVSVAEGVLAYQLFEQYLLVAEKLQAIAKTYKGKKITFKPPDVIKEAMKQLKEIADWANKEKPAS